jgi:hypothetical protein
VLGSFLLGRFPMALVFNGLELGAILLAVLIADQVTQEGSRPPRLAPVPRPRQPGSCWSSMFTVMTGIFTSAYPVSREPGAMD